MWPSPYVSSKALLPSLLVNDKLTFIFWYDKLLSKIHPWILQDHNTMIGLLKKVQSWKQINHSLEVFINLIKVVLVEFVFHLLLDFKLSFKLDTNTFEQTIGSIFLQEVHLVAFERLKHSATTQHYSIHNKKGMVIIIYY